MQTDIRRCSLPSLDTLINKGKVVDLNTGMIPYKSLEKTFSFLSEFNQMLLLLSNHIDTFIKSMIHTIYII